MRKKHINEKKIWKKIVAENIKNLERFIERNKLDDRDTLYLILEIFKENKKKLDRKKMDDKQFYEIIDSIINNVKSLLDESKENK